MNRIRVAEIVHVPEAYLDQNGVWNPIYAGVICFACNRDWFERKDLPLPDCWDDLLRPELAGQIVMASPASSGTSYTMLAALVQQRGEPAAWSICVHSTRMSADIPGQGSNRSSG